MKKTLNKKVYAKMGSDKLAFTLVELIVVITILAILGTIAFISLQGYSSQARDSKRLSDISNIKKSLELFSLNTGKYPEPDSGVEVSFSGELLWTQGIIGDQAMTNLSRNLSEKPIDPLLGTEYVYSVINTQLQYEILVNYENIDLVNINLLKNSYAVNYIPKISGTYNGIFVKTVNFIFPSPSIINALNIELDFNDNNNALQSQVVTGFDNNILNGQIQTSTGNLDMIFTYTGTIDDNSTDAEKISVIETLQQAYSGTLLANNNEIANVLSQETDEEKKDLAEFIILNSGIVRNTVGTQEEVMYNSCKTILESGGSTGNGIYTIDPENNGTGFEVYCDMEIEGGGWTRLETLLVYEQFAPIMQAIDSASIAGIDEFGRPYTRDASDDHEYTYTWTLPFDITEVMPKDYIAKANAGPGDSSDFGYVSYIDGDIILKSSNVKVFSFADEGHVSECEACEVSFNGNDNTYSVSSSQLQLNWSENGDQHEGWYPWWSGYLYVR